MVRGDGVAIGFDSIQECYGDLADHIFAVETGLSSDPAMNWRVSSLDRYRLTSNSDAHSPGKLGREATRFSASPTTSRSAMRWRPGKATRARWSSSPRRGNTTWTGIALAASCGNQRRPSHAAASAQFAAGASRSGWRTGWRCWRTAPRRRPLPPPTAGVVTSLVPLPRNPVRDRGQRCGLEGGGPGL
ncbi:MAG: hypothetical protein WDN49_06810 [Acetobacteraceae bacterium]